MISDAVCRTVTVHAARGTRAIVAPAWFAIGGITLMSVNQSMIFSFIERIGTERGFGAQVLGVLLTLGFVNLLAPILAALLEPRLLALAVARGGAILQVALAATLAFSSGFAAYAMAGAVFVSVMIFSHTFVFGWLSRHDASGRAVALTPAMLMSGAALGPLAGGTLVAAFGIASLGLATIAIGAAAFACFWLAARRSRALPAAAPSFSH